MALGQPYYLATGFTICMWNTLSETQLGKYIPFQFHLDNYSAFACLELHCTVTIIIWLQYSLHSTYIITSNLWKKERKRILHYTNSHCFFQKLMFCFDSSNYLTLFIMVFYLFFFFFWHDFFAGCTSWRSSDKKCRKYEKNHIVTLTIIHHHLINTSHSYSTRGWQLCCTLLPGEYHCNYRR